MFTHLRQTAQGFFFKLIMALLVGMFVLWGVGPAITQMGGAPTTVATVGKDVITVQEFRRMNQRARRQAKPQEVLAGMINDSLVEQEVKSLGIVVSDDEIADFISHLKEFQNKAGQFDKALYQSAVVNSGISEHQFIEDIRREIGAKLAIDTLTDSVQVPENMVSALYKAQEEQRGISLIYISSASVAAHVTAPTDQEIKAYYDAHPKEFMAPEYRRLTYVVLPLTSVQSKIDVSASDIKQAYDEQKDNYRTPEKREVEEMQFDNEQDEKAVADQLEHGKKFADIMVSAPLSNKGKTSLGTVSTQDLPPEAAGAVFALPQDGTSAPVFANFAWHIYHVSKIVPERPDTFEEARPLIVNEISARAAQETASKLINGFEDALAGGASLDSAAEKIGQKLNTVGPVTHDGLTQEGKKADLPPYKNFMDVAFALPEKEHSQAVQTSDGSYFLVRADSVMPAHVKPLADVKAQVIKSVLTEKTQEKLEKTADSISEQIRAGKSAAEALASAGINEKPVASGKIKLETQTVPEGPLKGKPLSRGLVSEIFRLKAHDSTHAYPIRSGDYMIASLSDITPAPEKADPKVLDDIRAGLKQTLEDEILHQYLASLRVKYPITLNTDILSAKNSPVKDEGDGE